MPPALTPLKFTLTIHQVPPAEVARAFTHATALRDWLCVAAQTEAQVGGRFYAYWNATYHVTGQYTALDAQKVAFTWHGSTDPGPSQVKVALRAKGPDTVLTLTHAGFGPGKAWAATRETIEIGWRNALENLPAVLEKGEDLRVMRAPRMGILIEDFNPAIAAALGVPVKKGIRLGGTADGSGASAAGLQKDDVLIKLAGLPIFDFPSLVRALHGLQAGDVVPVVFYRGATKQKADLPLMARPPLDALPPDGAALAAIARQNYAGVVADFKKQLAKVSATEAEQRPAPTEWNLKELVAHFIACERDLQSWIADMVNDNVVGDSLEFRPNVTPRLAAICQRYPTLPKLLAELQAACAETANLLEALPPAFVARKHMYRRVVWWINQVVPSHLPFEHQAQLQSTLQAARAA